MAIENEGQQDFDFDTHRDQAIKDYRAVKPRYEVFVSKLRDILRDALSVENIQIHSIEARAKDIKSFGNKVTKPSEVNPNVPKYPNPLSEITDLAGVRVITFLPKTVYEIEKALTAQFQVIERVDKGQELSDQGKFGYQSVHLLLKLARARARLPEYTSCKDLVAEVQVRTILQHAWAELEHDIQYKSYNVIPKSIRRRFAALAGLLEIADREFQSLQDEDERLRQQARASVQIGDLATVEITPDALKLYLDRKLGSDGRMPQWSYDFTANMLQELGFETLSELDECIANYDDDKVSRAIWGARRGQLARLEDTVLASMGNLFIERHPWAREPKWKDIFKATLDELRNSGIEIGSFNPNLHRKSDE